MVAPIHNIDQYQSQKPSKNSGGGSNGSAGVVRNGSQSTKPSTPRPRQASHAYTRASQPSKTAKLPEESPTSASGNGGGFNTSIRNDYKPWTPPGRALNSNSPVQTGTGDAPCARDDASSRDAVLEGSVDASPPPSLVESNPERVIPGTENGNGKSESSNECSFLSFGRNSGEGNDIVRVLSEKTSKWIEEFEEKRRKETAEHRISQALIGLRAASERSKSLENLKYHGGAGRALEKTSLRDMVGDVGLAIFSPLDEVAFEPLKTSKSERRSSRFITNGMKEDKEEDETDEYPVEVMPENPLILAYCPRLLTHKMMQQLVDEALPEIVKTMRWKRIFAIGRDGDAFCTMNKCCASFKHTIVVVQTTEGHILGGYATELWQRQEGHNKGRSFFGSGQSFLFTSHPSIVSSASGGDKDNREKELCFFKWTGSNRYCQVFDVDSGLLAMGGGGAFGLIVEDNFSRGGTGQCDTFGNPPLVPFRDERFDIANFEVYGFVSASQSFTPPNSPVFLEMAAPRV